MKANNPKVKSTALGYTQTLEYQRTDLVLPPHTKPTEFFRWAFRFV